MKKIFTSNSTGGWIIFWTMVCSALISNPAQANNIRINAPVKVSAGTGDTLVLEFPLQWDNSWRDEFNWDAAWVFLKYKVGTGDWKHVPLSFGGHSFNGSSGQPVHFDHMPGQTGSNTLGIFVYRSRPESGNTPEIICKLKCLKSALGGITPEKFDKHEAFIRAQGIEMVYVPYGAYYLGDGGCDNRFSGASDGSAALIDNEDVINASTATKLYVVSNGTVGAAQAIAAAYPKGYKGFYTMKYELSQEQYVAFLNSLSYAQQQERVPGLASMKEGDYIFGDRSQLSNRNGICVAVASFSNQPVLFANNLTNDGKYAQDNDGKTVACNYLSPNDMLGYCSWSGLRPMSELEYEKACRSSYPDPVVAKSYAWGGINVAGRLASVNNGGQRNEVSGTSGANVNSGNTFGPVRCGLFATSASNQQTAGATFWGAMEMSGNLKELCYNVNAAITFNGGVLGDGSYSLTAWNNAVGNFGVRGGGFTSGDDLLRVSDRTEATGYFMSLEQHDSTVTFRGVYPIAGAVDAGTIEVVSVCPDNIEIKSSKDASSKFDLTYMWYVLKPGSSVWEMMPGETGAAISNYVITEDLGTAASKVYKFKRKAVALVGEATTAEASLTVPNMKLTLSASEVSLNMCNMSDKTIIATVATGNCQWYYKNNLLPVSGNNYIADRSHFGDESKAGGDFTVVCHYNNSGCKTEQRLVVHVDPDNLTCPSTVQDNGGNSYPVVKISCQCWLGKNLNHAVDGSMCYSNLSANCDTYGRLYTWAAAKTACPDGWHLPSDEEWGVLESYLGIANPTGMTGSRGNVNSLKVNGSYNGYTWCTSGCNTTGFNLLPSGAPSVDNGYYRIGEGGYWWSSTVTGGVAWSRLVTNGQSTGIHRYTQSLGHSFAVRCLKD